MCGHKSIIYSFRQEIRIKKIIGTYISPLRVGTALVTPQPYPLNKYKKIY